MLKLTNASKAGLEILYRDALDARLEVIGLPDQDEATREAAELLQDIAVAAAVCRGWEK